MKYQFINNNESMTIYHFLKEIKLSESCITRLRKQLGFLSINGIPKRTNEIIQKGDTLEINYVDPQIKQNYQPCNIPFKIVYEDDYYLIVDKPTDICTIPTLAHYNDNLASAVLFYQKLTNQSFVFRALNRLDLGTSGIVIIAKDIISANLFHSISKPFKRYLAIVVGKVNDCDKIVGAIEDNRNTKKYEVDINSKKTATTNYTLIKYNNKLDLSLLDINLVHGRTNQIRVHMASINHPLAGDIKYGGNKDVLNSFFLRCYYLKFYHPIKQKVIELTLDSAVPNELFN